MNLEKAKKGKNYLGKFSHMAIVRLLRRYVED